MLVIHVREFVLSLAYEFSFRIIFIGKNIIGIIFYNMYEKCHIRNIVCSDS